MYLELEKIKQAALYLTKNVPDLYLTKFLKLFYYIDFISVLERGESVTNDTYYHLQYGPVPSFIKDQIGLIKKEIRDAEEDVFKEDSDSLSLKSIFSDTIEIKSEGSGDVLVSEVDPDLSYLSEYEVNLIDDIIKEFKDTTTKDLVDKTHSEVPYTQTPQNNIIDYKLAFHLDRTNILPDRNYDFNPEISQAEFFGN